MFFLTWAVSIQLKHRFSDTCIFGTWKSTSAAWPCLFPWVGLGFLIPVIVVAKWRFIYWIFGSPYQTSKNPGGDHYWEGGTTQPIFVSGIWVFFQNHARKWCKLSAPLFANQRLWGDFRHLYFWVFMKERFMISEENLIEFTLYTDSKPFKHNIWNLNTHYLYVSTTGSEPQDQNSSHCWLESVTVTNKDILV